MARTAQFALCVTTAVSAADVPQLRGRQLASQAENCKVCYDHGYTGYNHKNSGGPGHQEMFTVYGGAGENPWWRCAEMCSHQPSISYPHVKCQGWTFAYDGSHATSYKCYLKWDVKPESAWSHDPNVISGLWEPSSELSSESPGDPLCSALSPTDPGPCPDVKGRSGANISHDPKIQCVYNPECLKEPLKGCFEETGCQYADVPQLRGLPLASQAGNFPPCPTGSLVMEDVCEFEHGAGSKPHSDPSKGDGCWSCHPGGGVDLDKFANQFDNCCLVNKGTTPEAKCYGWKLDWAHSTYHRDYQNPQCRP